MGPVRSALSVLAFLSPPEESRAALGAPAQSLAWFERTHVLEPGGHASFEIRLSARDFAVAAVGGDRLLPVEGTWQLRVGDHPSVTSSNAGGGGGGSTGGLIASLEVVEQRQAPRRSGGDDAGNGDTQVL